MATTILTTGRCFRIDLYPTSKEVGWLLARRWIKTTAHIRYPFRPPYGKLNLISLLHLWIHRVPVYYWTLVSGDTRPAGKRDSSLAAAMAGGAVVLAHDFDRADDSVDDFVLESLNAALETAEQSGMEVRTLSELMSEKA